jgi:hypothetical protein
LAGWEEASVAAATPPANAANSATAAAVRQVNFVDFNGFGISISSGA